MGADDRPQSNDDGTIVGRLAGFVVGGAFGAVGGVVGLAVGIAVSFGVALVVLSPVLYPVARGITCYPLDVYPEVAVGIAEWYTRLFSGVYGNLGCSAGPP